MFPETAQLLAAPRWLLDLIDSSTRITILLGAAGLTVLALRRAPAHARHLVWTLALAGTLLVPVAGRLLPGWPLRILPPAATAPAFDDPAEFPGDTRLAVGRATFEAKEPFTVMPVWAPTRARLATTTPLTLDRWLLAVWLTGIAAVLVKMLFDRARIWFLSDRAKVISDEREALFRRQLARLGIARSVRLVEVEDTGLPMTWGVFTPTVALPASSRWWSGARLEAVLLHELAHVRRHDALTQLVAQLACAAYWVHPFVWWAAREMRVLREYACDDEVLGQGVRPSSYAEEILGIVKSLRPEGLASGATMAMAQPSELKARIIALLDPRVPHQRLDRTRQLTIGAGALGLALSLAVVRPAAAEPPPPEAPATTGATKAAPPAAATDPRAPRIPSQPAAAPSASAPPPVPPEPPATPPGSRHRRSGVRIEVNSSPDDTCDEPRAARGDAEAKRRLEALAKTTAKDADLAQELEKIGQDEDLELDGTRQLYLTQVARLNDDQARLDALEALLVGAPISAETGRAVLAFGGRFKEDGPRAELLAAMLHINEWEHIQGSLALAYLDVASQLTAPEALAEALRDLLHATEVRTEAEERALKLAGRLESTELRQEVLTEVTDHQRITPSVEALYLGLTARFTGEAQDDAAERLTEAKAEHRGRGTRRWVWSFRSGGEQQAQHEAAAFREQEVRLEQQAARLEEQAARLKDQAVRLKEQAKEHSRQLKERLKRRGKAGGDVDVDVDVNPGDERSP